MKMFSKSANRYVLRELKKSFFDKDFVKRAARDMNMTEEEVIEAREQLLEAFSSGALEV